jgi:hypothetical protein
LSTQLPLDLRSFGFLEPTPEALDAFCAKVHETLRVDAVQVVRPEQDRVIRLAGSEPSREIAKNLLVTAGDNLRSPKDRIEQTYRFADKVVHLLGTRGAEGRWLLVWARLENPEALDLARQFVGLAAAGMPGSDANASPLARLGAGASSADDDGLGPWLVSTAGGTHVFLARRGWLGWRMMAAGPSRPTEGSRLTRYLRRLFSETSPETDRQEVARLTGAAQVLRLPLADGMVAIVAGAENFTPRTTELNGVARLLGHSKERSLPLAGAGGLRILAFAAAAGLALAALFVSIPDRIRVLVALEPSLRRYVAAPFDGLVEEVHGQRGDLVHKGDVLVQFNGREILERTAEIESKLASAKLQNAAALGASNYEEAVIRTLDAQSLQHELAVLRHQKENLLIRSSIDGVVIGGELDKAKGAAVQIGQPLLEIAPLNPLIAEFMIPDRDVSLVQGGERAEILLDALPNRKLHVELSQVRPRSETRGNENVFVAEATIENDDQKLRPGMRGHGVVIAPAKPLGWLLIRKPWGVFRSWLFR